LLFNASPPCRNPAGQILFLVLRGALVLAPPAAILPGKSHFAFARRFGF
jgi:hypothetical protein